MAADTDLLQGNLQVLVQVHGLKQVLRAALEPHKQVTWRDSLLEAQQLDVKDQHGTAGNPSGWWEQSQENKEEHEELRIVAVYNKSEINVRIMLKL